MTTLKALLLALMAVLTGAAKKYPVWPFDFKWSVEGKLNSSEYKCVTINEPEQPLLHHWHDNHLCYKINGYDDPDLSWSFTETKPGLKCTKFWEPSDTVDWHDNYLCVPDDSLYNFKYSYSGCYRDLDCISVNEPDDPDMWFDNYLCNDRTGRFNETYDMNTNCVSYNADHRIMSPFWLTVLLCACTYVSFS